MEISLPTPMTARVKLLIYQRVTLMNFIGWRAVPISNSPWKGLQSLFFFDDFLVATLGFPGLRWGWADPIKSINLRLGDGFNPICGDDLGWFTIGFTTFIFSVFFEWFTTFIFTTFIFSLNGLLLGLPQTLGFGWDCFAPYPDRFLCRNVKLSQRRFWCIFGGPSVPNLRHTYIIHHHPIEIFGFETQESVEWQLEATLSVTHGNDDAVTMSYGGFPGYPGFPGFPGYFPWWPPSLVARGVGGPQNEEIQIYITRVRISDISGELYMIRQYIYRIYSIDL